MMMNDDDEDDVNDNDDDDEWDADNDRDAADGRAYEKHAEFIGFHCVLSTSTNSKRFQNIDR